MASLTTRIVNAFDVVDLIGVVGVVPLLLATALATTSAHAQAPASLSNEDLQHAQVETLRKAHSNDLHLQAYDLLDELVYGWTTSPPFETDTLVVLADVTVPTGFGSGLEALLENHLADLLLRHPETHVLLAHCPACSQVVVHSDKSGSVISRGVDQPAVLAKIAGDSGARHALFVDVEAEGSALVTRVRLTTLSDELRLVASRTLTTSTSAGAMLRSGDKLVSAETARKEYLDALQQRGPLSIPLKLSLTQFAPPSSDPETGAPPGLAALPIIWLQTGAEFNLNHARDWSGSLVVGGTFIPQLYSGAMVEARVNRLVSGASASLTHPNLYLFGGASISALFGPGALQLRDTVPTLPDLFTAVTGATFDVITWPSFTLGLDLRVGNRVGAAFFVQTTPTLVNAPAVGRYVDFGLVQIHTLGGEVSLWF